MNYTNFVALNKIGSEGERNFAAWLEANGYTNIQHIDEVYEEEKISRSDWDIRCYNDVGLPITFEIKTQNKAHLHGTVNVEQVQNGKPGGLAVTYADFFVFVNPNLGYGIIDTKELKHTHRMLKIQATMMDYNRKKVKCGVQLWKTNYTNWAAGWKMDVNDIKWYK